jgi:hypothetical protein
MGIGMGIEQCHDGAEQERSADVDHERDPPNVVRVAAETDVEPVTCRGSGGACECNNERDWHADSFVLGAISRERRFGGELHRPLRTKA